MTATPFSMQSRSEKIFRGVIAIYLRATYRILLKRKPDPEGLAHYCSFITTPRRLIAATLDIANSTERRRMRCSLPHAAHHPLDAYLALLPTDRTTEAPPHSPLLQGPSPAAWTVDSAWYLDRYPDVAQAGVDPVAHFNSVGLTEGRYPNRQASLASLFDTERYLNLNPDLKAANVDALQHYISTGHAECRPGTPLVLALFDRDFYLSRYPDVVAQGMAPIEHFIEYGWPQGRQGSSLPPNMRPVFQERQFHRPEAEHLRQVKAIAFYLPQFHPIPENNEWWGAGFTEWRNVARARPFYEKHLQPREPEALGYYDLRLAESIRAQADLARIHGIYGFCFYYYWFGGRRLLEKPLQILLADTTINLPFCICWANENWTRTWDGLEKEVLIEQGGTEDSEASFIQDAATLFKDSRYIKVARRPLLVIYRPNLLKSPKQTIQRWRQWCRDHGFGEIYICMVESFERVDPSRYGIDASIEFPPLLTPNRSITHQIATAENFSGQVYSYLYTVEQCSKAAPRYHWTRYRGVMPGWDNTARRMERGFSFFGNTPYLFERWLSAVVEDTLSCEYIPEKLVFINAWNEWAEGAYLEPDLHNGYGYLNSLRKSIYKEDYSPPPELTSLDSALPKASRLAVICHLFHIDLAEGIAAEIRKSEIAADVFLSVRAGLSASNRAKIEELFPGALIFEFPNRGRDVLPFLQILGAIRHNNYFAICKIHSKKSSHRLDGDSWRKRILGDLLGSPRVVEKNISAIRDGAGIVAPGGHLLRCKDYMGANRARLETLAVRMGAASEEIDNINFPAGTMFWFSPKALDALMSLSLGPEDFEAENGQLDGTTAHAVERLIGLSCELGGLSLAEFSEGTDTSSTDRAFAFATKSSS